MLPQFVLLSIAYHWIEMSVKMRFLGHKGIPEIKALNERSAVELGAEALGEAIVLGICTALIVFEFRRGKLKEAKKEEARLNDRADLRRQVQELGLQIETLSAQVRENSRYATGIQPTTSVGRKDIEKNNTTVVK